MALMCDVTEPRERSVAYGFLNFMGGLGSILVYLVSDTLAVTTDLLASLWHLRSSPLCLGGRFLRKRSSRVSPLVNSGSWCMRFKRS